MKKIAELVGKDTQWQQPSAFDMEYELCEGDEITATVRFRSMFGSFATAESADGCWTFKRVGFFTTRVAVRECGSDEEIASFKNNTWSGGGTLELSGGREYRATTNFWASKLEFQDESGQALFRLASAGIVHHSATLEIEPAAARLPELPWMVMLGWYLTVLMRHEGGGAAAAAAAG